MRPLQGMTVQGDVFLIGDTGFGGADTVTIHQMNLRLDDIDSGHFFRHRVLNLHPRIDLDKIEIT